MENVKGELADILRFRQQYGGSFDRFLSSLLVSCQDVVIECQVKFYNAKTERIYSHLQVGSNAPVDGNECCSKYFDSKAHLTAHGTCFGTRLQSIPARDGLTVTTRHETLDMDLDIASSDMVTNVGLAVAVVDNNVSPPAALLSQVTYRSSPFTTCD